MSLSTAAMQRLQELGLSLAEIIEVSGLNDAPVDAAAEKRRAYDRQRKRNSTGIPPEPVQSNSTGNSTGIPPETPALTRVRDITPNSEISGLAVVVEVSASDCATNDWPKGDVAQALIETIASPRLDSSKSQGLATTAGRLAAWRRDGASWQFDVLPVIQAAVRKTGPPIGTWKYFDAAIAQSIADNRQALTIPKARNHGSPQPPGQQSKQADNLARALAGADLASQFLAQRR